jgi:hypothetical protein
MITTSDMKHFKYTKEVGERGITLLITLLLMGVLLGVSTSLLNITLKQYQLAGIALSSEIAFQSANAGLECILYHDFPEIGESPFEVNGDYTTVSEENDIQCFDGIGSSDIEVSNNGVVQSGDEQRFRYTWGTAPNEVCSDVSIYKFFESPSYDGDAVGPDVVLCVR